MSGLLDDFPSVRFSFYIEPSQHVVWESISGGAGGCCNSHALECTGFSEWIMMGLVLFFILMKK